MIIKFPYDEKISGDNLNDIANKPIQSTDISPTDHDQNLTPSVCIDTQKSPIICKQPLHLKAYVCTSTTSSTSHYPISNYLSYSHLSSTH